MVAGPSKGPDRNQKPSAATLTSTCTSTITVFVVDVDVHVHVDVFFENPPRREAHSPECQTPAATPEEPGDLPTY